MRFQRDDIDKFYDYDINLAHRILYIGSKGTDWEDGETGVDYKMAERVIKGLAILDSKAPDGDKPIDIIMNNPGGDWYHGMAIYDAIRFSRNLVRITAFGYVMSMGSVIFQAADERIMAPNCRMMLHYGSDGAVGHTLDFIKHAEEAKKLNRKMEDIYLEKINQKHPAFTRKDLQERIKFDMFLSAQQALKFGLVDGVLGESDDC